MHRVRVWVRGFFGFSRKETNAFLILLPLMIVILVSEPMYERLRFRNGNPNLFDQHYSDSVLASLTYSSRDSQAARTTVKSQKKEIHFKYFNPNDASEQDLVELGLAPFMAGRIVSYREKGGTFRKKEDLLRIYGIDSAWFRKASAWIKIPERITKPSDRPPEGKKFTKPEITDLNTADSAQLVRVFGVGPALSKRIRGYRKKLGGFVSMDQLKEVYGLDTLALKELKANFFLSPEFVPRQIDLNTCNIDTLTKHPYVKWKEAQAIVNYRNQHGKFASPEDLAKVQIITTEWLNKMRRYVRAGNTSGQ